MDRGDDLRVAVAGGNDSDACGKIEERVAVHVFNYRAAASFNDERIITSVRRRKDLSIALHNLLGLGAGQRSNQVRKLGFNICLGRLHVFLQEADL